MFIPKEWLIFPYIVYFEVKSYVIIIVRQYQPAAAYRPPHPCVCPGSISRILILTRRPTSWWTAYRYYSLFIEALLRYHHAQVTCIGQASFESCYKISHVRYISLYLLVVTKFEVFGSYSTWITSVQVYRLKSIVLKLYGLLKFKWTRNEVIYTGSLVLNIHLKSMLTINLFSKTFYDSKKQLF